MKAPASQTITFPGGKVVMPVSKSLRAYRAVQALELPLPRGAVKAIAATLDCCFEEVSVALSVRRAFDRAPALREKWEPQLLKGVVGARFVLSQIKKETGNA